MKFSKRKSIVLKLNLVKWKINKVNVIVLLIQLKNVSMIEMYLRTKIKKGLVFNQMLSDQINFVAKENKDPVSKTH